MNFTEESDPNMHVVEPPYMENMYLPLLSSFSWNYAHGKVQFNIMSYTS